MIHDSLFISRCLELARKGSGNVAPNPMVGSVLVYNNKIIGEGFHHAFGESHAEVNAINQCTEKGNEYLLEKSVLYVNLEPCSHSGKTPPCTDLILKHKIPKVVIGMKDPFPEVFGKGIKKLEDAGIKVVSGILEKECREANNRFITFHTQKRPFIVLKFAQTADHFIAPMHTMNNKISNEFTDILVHKWRSEESAILIGTKTAAIDNPFLTVRKWKGKNPLRVVMDKNLRLPENLHLFDQSVYTLVFNSIKNKTEKNIEFVKIDFDENVISKILSTLHERKILSVLIEGGRNVLSQFIEKNLWDEARIITSNKLFVNGMPSPEIHGKVISKSNATGDTIVILRPENR